VDPQSFAQNCALGRGADPEGPLYPPLTHANDALCQVAVPLRPPKAPAQQMPRQGVPESGGARAADATRYGQPKRPAPAKPPTSTSRSKERALVWFLVPGFYSLSKCLCS